MAMATTSEIGSLRVRLALDAAEFIKGGKSAEGAMEALAAKASEIGASIGTALKGGLVAIGAGLTLAGIKAAADSLHDLAKTADGIGITTDQLQELGHVALQAGISHETFNETLKTFKDRLKEAFDGSGELVDKLKENDLAFLNTLRGTKDVSDALKLLADHYNELTDNAKRSELANAAFGANTEELTRFLENGSAGIKKMSDEASGLGLVVSKASVQTGTEFAEAIRKLTVVVDESSEAFGVTLKNAIVLVAPLLEGLVGIAIQVIVSIQGISTAIKEAFSTTAAEQVTQLTTKVTDAANALAEAEAKLAKQPGAVGLENIVKTRQGQLDALNQQLAVAQGELDRTTSGIMGPKPADTPVKLPDIKETDDEKAKRLAAEHEAQRIMNQELDRYNTLRREGKKIIDETATPEEAMLDRQDKLNRLLQAGAIDADTYGRAMQKATLVAVGAYAGMASAIAGNLEKVFSNSKAVAIASALINTFEGATKALAAYPPPFNFAVAASVVAAGLAQVANIRKTSKGSTGGGDSGSGATASADTGTGSGSTSTQGGVNQTLFVQGISPTQMFSGDVVRNFAESLLAYQRDGGKVILDRA
jgi:hypothetical protein